MSKIIIENEADLIDSIAMRLVYSVISSGKISGENQYCWATQFTVGINPRKVTVIARKPRGDTHSFKIVRGEDE